MRILAHRGYWLSTEEKNTAVAFERALKSGFGIETDLRDADGELVISHDMPKGGEMKVGDFLDLCIRYPEARPLALNVKADGMQSALKALLGQRNISEAEYFVFDMSFPDGMNYLASGLTAYTRFSEYESPPLLLSEMSGVWIDAFHGDWYGEEALRTLLGQGKEICIVSPELHRRPHLPLWKNLKMWRLHILPKVKLCTDFPMQAREFFGD
jgi:hypothetical protein